MTAQKQTATATAKEKEKELQKKINELEDQLSSKGRVARKELRLAMVQSGLVRVNHARADAQNVDRAIDDILGVWGGE